MATQRVTTLPPLPGRQADAHKGTFGHVLIVAGSPGMSGAAVLSGLGALRGGAGLVSVAVPSSILVIVAGAEPAYLTIPLSVDKSTGRLKASALEEIQSALKSRDVGALGPGLGQSPEVRSIISTLYQEQSTPLVIDADGLNCLSERKDLLSDHAGPRILTPHPGEFARLLGSDVPSILKNREDLAVEFAATHDVVLVLKGQGTIVTDGIRLYTNTTGNSGMATGGTGDVLTGVIAALAAQTLSPFQAAQLGVFLHGRAGDLAAKALSPQALISSDLAQFLGSAWLSLQQSH